MDVSLAGRARADGARTTATGWTTRSGSGWCPTASCTCCIAWLALRLAFGDGGGSASSQGALHQLAKTAARPGLAVRRRRPGFVALVVWQALEALWGHRDEERRQAGPQAGRPRPARWCSTRPRGHRAQDRRRRPRPAAAAPTGSPPRLMSAARPAPLLVGAVGLGDHRGRRLPRLPRLAETFRDKLETDGQTGKDGRRLRAVRQDRLRRQGGRARDRRRAVPLRRLHPRPAEVRRARPGAAQAAPAAVRRAAARWWSRSASPATGCSASRGRATSTAEALDHASQHAAGCRVPEADSVPGAARGPARGGAALPLHGVDVRRPRGVLAVRAAGARADAASRCGSRRCSPGSRVLLALPAARAAAGLGVHGQPGAVRRGPRASRWWSTSTPPAACSSTCSPTTR